MKFYGHPLHLQMTRNIKLLFKVDMLDAILFVEVK